MKLDARDIEILRVLSAEGRITKAELARRINLSPTPCWERLKRLEEAGVIAGYHAEISPRALGPHVTIFVAVELEGHKAEAFQAFERGVMAYEEVTGCWALGGGFDYLMQVVTTDIDTYQRLIDTMLEARIGLARYYTYIVTKPVKSSAGIPPGLLPDPG
ncbi:AsnC family transcriptional regulator [Maritimibacter sp. 55A14]|uniref:Lrp/AsnC family transcriptional regulator n=1 Tax=Maritimibacter sp. 55A14 TaxID=2174844 RepID=UPI000D61B759|nr:Lrp/AsnC family transcriptional regulator [Maritimibacter sp. 55A14]PWE31207.1 AsnC family transcriptional regulator [Maritimibacter sp. 55A14]